MEPSVHEFVKFVEVNKHISTKNEMIAAVSSRFAMARDGRALFHTDSFAVVFCYSKNSAFSNAVLSLSKLEKYDGMPCFVVLVRKNLDNVIYLINTTFLDKISHSSQNLRADNIRGSFLGGNIRKELPEIGKRNIPADFDELFSYHQTFTWQENIERLVENTNNIKSNKAKVVLDDAELRNVFEAPERAVRFVTSADYEALLADLRSRCEAVKEAIRIASHIDKVNIRGRLIEVLITSDCAERNRLLSNLEEAEHLLPSYDTRNDLGDCVFHCTHATVYTDIKTKILYLDSNPKAYNIDKFLECMGRDNSVFMFFFVGIDERGFLNTALASVFHDTLQRMTLLQSVWAGRGTRGTAQFCGKAINEILHTPHFVNKINEEESRRFLQVLLDK